MINTQEIEDLTVENLFDDELLENTFSNENDLERVREIALLKLRAKALDCEKEFGAVIKAYEKQLRKDEEEERKNNIIHTDLIASSLETNDKGKPVATIANFLAVMRRDEHFAKLQYNNLKYSPETIRKGKVERWTDADDAATREYIESKYHFHNVQKCDDGLRILFREREYHPIKDAIESVKWDGVSRIYTLLSKWLKCEDNEYTREVSRLIFAGGIHRIYRPGCQFDDVPVLIGTKQGEGKSSFVSWLAMNDEWYAEISEIEGQKGMESVDGVWIAELGELCAVTRSKEVEAVKSFITRRVDHYRKSYDHRVADYPRQCIFIGTTNKEQFLTDKTGNRRWYPVKVHSSGYDLHDHKEEIQADIKQCWAEAKVLYDAGELHPCADKALINKIRKAQSDATEDDYRVGMIEAYLEDKTETCVMDLWQNALDNTFSKPARKDSTEIGLIMQNFDDWQKTKLPIRMLDGKYGKVRGWTRVEKVYTNELPF